MLSSEIKEIEGIIGYRFKNKELLIRAFTHSSYTNEHRHEESYERLEFLGDAALNYIIGLYLYETFPSLAEGKLSKVRAGTVDRETVAEVVDGLNLLRFMRVGKGSENLSSGFSTKVKCDLFEAVVGAMVIDNDEDISEAKRMVEKFLQDKISLNNTDYKSRLLEKCAKEGKEVKFSVTERANSGSERFFATLFIDGKEAANGKGENKKSAERAAAKQFLNL